MFGCHIFTSILENSFFFKYTVQFWQNFSGNKVLKLLLTLINNKYKWFLKYGACCISK